MGEDKIYIEEVVGDNDYTNHQHKSNGKAITGMVLGIVALVFFILVNCCLLGVGHIIGIPLAIVGLVISIKAKKTGQSKGMSIAGIVCSIVTLVLAISTLIVITLLVAGIAVIDYDDIVNIMSDIYYGYEDLF